ALEKNNQNTGGAYIDKKPNAYFIRGLGLVSSLDDVRNIVIKTDANGVPVFVRDVAEVKFGGAVRYGALTYNGEKEAVGGVVMMLKGANSFEVVSKVKVKMETIQKSLPADVEIEPFLDRADLVNRAINTVQTNLIEGALIVVFVLVLFLGNLRAGLIVASAIPLSMLFALGMMRQFGVSANLMSLGAIDFGLIVDGAVIIVEATMHYLVLQKLGRPFTQSEMDEGVAKSAGRMMNSAAFGQIIILIVYLPILSLIGIEGKMFGPMALTVAFAILGALILSLTYIPMMSALFLPKNISHKKNISDRLMDFFQRIYAPVIRGAIRFKYGVVTATLVLLAVSVLLFSRIGGEFIPQLQEGDYAFHCILPQGTSLSQSVETSMQAMRIIKQFPEVKMVVGKTGSAEVPTDPMPPEATDMMVMLKPMKEWTTTKDYNELAAMIMEKLEVIPGVFFEASQPIQMRFNELMTGVRQDVAIKIFGENIDTLAALAPKIAAVVQSVAGATAPQVERTTGLPQITIEYDRRRIGNYGLNIEGINHVVSTAFAGAAAGSVFENERKFDLVVRLDSANRTSIDDVSNLFIPTPGGQQIPLSQVATVTFKEGPAQISREEGKRRIVIGFNVRGRDVQSVVREIQGKLDQQAALPTGYYYTFGGTFENLEKATARLLIAVPVALALIFMLLFFTFNSFKEAGLIFTAIPMSAIGGVFALLLRDMPFSISAGVGFIALFGVAVLNGIVLIATFNQLQKDGLEDPIQRVLEGTRIRLRPVLMTAMVASLGFLPMAISTGAGAEVQKPLATVVIGGLITATFLTLVVLPLLYLFFIGKNRVRPSVIMPILLPALLFFSTNAHAQRRVTLEEALQIGLEQNLLLQADSLDIERAKATVETSFDLPKTGVFIENEDISSEDSKGILKIGLSQTVQFPTVYKARKSLFKEQVKYAELTRTRTEAELKRDIRTVYYQLAYLQERQLLSRRLDSLYTQLADAAALRARTGESTGLEKIAAEARLRELRTQQQQLDREVAVQQQSLMQLLNVTETLLPAEGPMQKLPVSATSDLANHPMLLLQRQNLNLAAADIYLQKQGKKPDFSGRAFSQYLYGISPTFSGFSFSVGVPIVGKSFRQKIKAAEISGAMQQKHLEYQTLWLNTTAAAARQELEKNNAALQFYETTGLAQADEITRAASAAYRAGEISFADLALYLAQAAGIRQNYLDNLNQYNQVAIQLYFLNNQ
ncbi:MAG TPA: CusA/CzcA family heavy metal efflux RND transporter, partial [Saprospiraceae bacterium]|nr:CusA/CzcA family heavy metal efflux RND transporter [Saprospiraceae bacterium]